MSATRVIQINVPVIDAELTQRADIQQSQPERINVHFVGIEVLFVEVVLFDGL